MPRELAVDDGARNLTERGVKKSLRHGRSLARMKAVPTEIWTSPLARAHQTAELMNRAFMVRMKVEPALSPAGDPQAVLNELARCADGASVMLVGHEPMMGQLATLLIAGNRSGNVQFKKGGVAAIEIDPHQTPMRGRLLWLLTPTLMA